MRQRRVFAASVVVTLAGCSGSAKEASGTGSARPSPFLQQWSVLKQVDDCRAHETINNCPPEVACNPPPPRAIECPAGDGTVMVAELPDHTCAIVPAGCTELACATTKTACPLPFGEEVFIQRWVVVRDDKGACTAVARGTSVPVACPYPDPLSGARSAVITRASATAPCFADAREQMKVEVPCPK